MIQYLEASESYFEDAKSKLIRSEKFHGFTSLLLMRWLIPNWRRLLDFIMTKYMRYFYILAPQEYGCNVEGDFLNLICFLFKIEGFNPNRQIHCGNGKINWCSILCKSKVGSVTLYITQEWQGLFLWSSFVGFVSASNSIVTITTITTL